MSVGARFMAWVVVLYRQTVGPLLGPRCRFEPTCSAYALEALRTHGAVRGGALTVWRLLRCQPLGTPGYDPVPPAAPRRTARRLTRGARPC